MTNPVARLWERRIIDVDDKAFVLKEVLTFCPGCKMSHPFTIDNGGMTRSSGDPRPTWEWDGNLESPTFSPSMLVYSSVRVCLDNHQVEPCVDHDKCGEKSHRILNYYEVVDETEWTYGHEVSTEDHVCRWGNCHSFLRAGVWEFLSDSAHSLAGQNVPMVPLPDFLMTRGF
jgi:hypothetical protein